MFFRHRQLRSVTRIWIVSVSLGLVYATGMLNAESNAYLTQTELVDRDHPAIRKLAAGFIEQHPEDLRARAVRIHDFVRDQIRFGWHGDFYDQSASEVLAAGVGFCNTKGTLFVALLRSSGIPARQRFVDIDQRILAPLINPGTPYVDHSYTEVWLGGQWIAVDSYIVDPALFRAAQRRLRAEGKIMGYGVHREGQNQWDGRSPAFAQFVSGHSAPSESESEPLSTRTYGVFADVRDFYLRSEQSWNRAGWLVRAIFPVFAWRAEQQLRALRAESPSA